MTFIGKGGFGIPTYVPVRRKKIFSGSHTQSDLVRACTKDFAVRYELTSRDSVRRPPLVALEHLCNLSVY